MIENLVVATRSQDPSKPNLVSSAIFTQQEQVSCAVVNIDDLAVVIDDGIARIFHPDLELGSAKNVVFRFAHRYLAAAHVLAAVLVRSGAKLNSSDLASLDTTENKIAQMVKLLGIDSNCNMPKTIYLPANNEKLFNFIETTLDYPCIVKSNSAMRGEDNFKVNTREQLVAACDSIGSNIVCQEYIPNDGDFRVLIIENNSRPLVLERKASGSSHLNNKSAGGTISLVEQPDPVLMECAMHIAEKLNYRLVGVDLMKHKEEGQWYFLEVNATPDLFNSFEGRKLSMLRRYFGLVDKKEE